MTLTDLKAWADAVALEVSPDGWSRLDRLIALWQHYGRAMNLVGTTERSALLEHVQEALQCIACVESIAPVDAGCRWVDVGSGGGLPGLVVAAVRPCELVLIEPRQRRAAFLDLALATLATGPTRLIRARWTDSTWNQITATEPEPRHRTPFYVLSSRAVFPPEVWLREAARARISRGIILCHVDSTTTRVGKKTPSTTMRGSRWTILGFTPSPRTSRTSND